MTTGTLKFFNAETSFGLITCDQGDDVIVYASNIQLEDGKPLEVGQKVEFDVVRGRQGDEAQNVRAATDPLAAAALVTAIQVERARLPRIRSTRGGVALSGVDAAPDGTARREGRGFVFSYGQGRPCAAQGCPTTLSRYNSRGLCWIHSPTRQ